MDLANDGNYRETRWFTGWSRPYELDEFVLPPFVQNVTGKEAKDR